MVKANINHREANACKAGSCLCGGVRFMFTLPHIRFNCCHCNSCQKSTGAGHAANILVSIDQFQWLAGEDLIQRFTDQASNPGFHRWFCSHCGGPVPRPSRNGQGIVIQAGLLDSPLGLQPERNIYWSEHPDWFVPMDTIPKFLEGLDSPIESNDFGSQDNA